MAEWNESQFISKSYKSVNLKKKEFDFMYELLMYLTTIAI